MQNKVNEFGRSMVEILGVLAVVGVLSITAIAGYKYAMEKYQANDIVGEVNARASDIYHRFQNIPLPETENNTDKTAFPEWNNKTQTGYPIRITTHPDVAFKIIVENIPQNVCKQVLNMKLNQIIQGLQFIQVNNIKYNNNSNLCTEAKSDNQIVFTSFINSENLENSQYCIEDTDCSQACGTATCEDDMMCHNKCSDTNTPFCLENNNDGICVECLVNTDCLNQNQVCEPTTHKCVDLPQTCGEGYKFGKEYRAANGSCVQCTFNANIILQNADDNDGIFEKKVGNIEIKDSHSGIEMCQACNNGKRIAETGKNDNRTTYCASTCIRGKEFLTTQYDCLPCSGTSEKVSNSGRIHVQTDLETYGNWAILTIPDDEQSRSLCQSCSNRILYGNNKCVLKNCPTGYFKADGICRSCEINKQDNSDCYSDKWPMCFDNYGAQMYKQTIPDELKQAWQNECSACPGKTIHRISNLNPFCTTKCNTNEFVSSTGVCYPCSSPKVVSLCINETGDCSVDGINLCNACKDEKGNSNRKYVNGNCVLDLEVCPAGYVMDKNKICRSCDTQGPIEIESDEASGCTKCNIANEEQGYTDVKKRWIDERENKLYCYNDCGEGYVQRGDNGKCKKCTDLGTQWSSGYPPSQIFTDMCANCSTATKTYSLTGGSEARYCSLTTCPSETFRFAINSCEPCSSMTYPHYKVDSKELCENNCIKNKRMYIDNKCILYKPGTYGVCNSDSPDPDNFPNYPAGIGTLYRDNDWKCHSCTSDASYKTTQKQCESCGDLRRFTDDSYCIKAGCEQTITFLSINNRCISCNTETTVAIADSTDSKQLCTSCSNHRVMQTGTNTYACVLICEDGDWQDISGECRTGISTIDNEIGIDITSQQLCKNANGDISQDGEKLYCIPK